MARSNIRLVEVISAVLLICCATVKAADLPTPTAPADNLVRSSLERFAELYLIRASFDVVMPSEIPAALKNDAQDLLTRRFGQQQLANLDEELLAEGSYYITSLAYLVEVDGAVWPTDRAESAYKDEALSQLAALRHEWLAAAGGTGDLKPLLHQIDVINAWTHGDADLVPELDHFGQLDRLVDDALLAANPRS